MHIPIFHVDAFADRPHTGNPAAVCLMDSWLDDESLRKVAAENNLPATAFLVKDKDSYELRWFTTRCEIRLCGHATLAAGFIVLKTLEPKRGEVRFVTKHGGVLDVRLNGETLEMDFPRLIPATCATFPERLMEALGVRGAPSEVLQANQTWIAVLQDQAEVAAADPKFELLETLHPYAAAITAPGRDEDFVTRYFAPSYGIPEDFVTGSVHCALAPYWSQRLRKRELHARQLSPRGGELWCEVGTESVRLKGKAILTMQGTLTI